jgi:hypothetical protein
MIPPEDQKTTSFKKAFILGAFFLVLAVVLIELVLLGFKKGLIASPALQIKALRAGFLIVYQNNPDDDVGRSVLAWEKRKDEGGFNDFWGGKKVWWKTGKLYGIYGVGFFEGWEKVENSKDKYMQVTGLGGQGNLKFRISLTDEYPPTRLIVENLDIKEDVAESTTFNRSYSETGFHTFLGQIELFGFEKLEKILKKGDTVAFVGNFSYSEKEGKREIKQGEDGQPIPLADENGVPVLSNIGIRRFGGLEQIGEELGINVSLYDKGVIKKRAKIDDWFAAI